MLIIGENINASNKKVGEAIARKDHEFIADLARKQAQAGADYIDVNAGSAQGCWESPEAAMEWLVDVVVSVTDKPLAIDSDVPSVVGAGLRRYQGDKVIGALVAGHGGLVIALAMGDGNIPKRAEERLDACKSIMSELQKMGVREEQVLFDPLVLPVSVDTSQAVVTLRTIEGIKSCYPSAKTVAGVSNVSYGLPNRDMVNRAFLLMAVAVGLDAAILNPLDVKMMSFIAAADLLVGKDTACRGYIRAHRRGVLTG
jgi:cobalamin-dependent methionine synthase I